MRPIDITSYNLRNVVFIGSSPFNGIQYKRIDPKTMTASDKENLATFEACNVKKQTCCGTHRCVWAVVRKTYQKTGISVGGTVYPLRK